MFSERSLDPNAAFIMALWINNLDDTIDSQAETPNLYETVEEAVASAKAMIGDSGGEIVIYECVPVKHVHRGKIRVTSIKPSE